MQALPKLTIPVSALVLVVLSVGATVAIEGGSAGPDSRFRRPATESASRREPPVPLLPRPEDFVSAVDNTRLPLTPGSRWVYRGRSKDGVERIVVRVLSRTRSIQGITATVVRDTSRIDGELAEDTFDWYAQDRNGTVWYLGEATTAYRNGRPHSTAGSWETGVDGASAGVAMPAGPVVGLRYRQEFLADEAEDQGVVLGVDAQVAVPAGRFRQVLTTRDTTPLEPDVDELKFYAPGVGLVLELGLSPEPETVRLVRYRIAGQPTASSAAANASSRISSPRRASSSPMVRGGTTWMRL